MSEFTVEPAALADRPKVGAFHRANLERIVSLKPDLILATRDGNSRDQVLRLESLGFQVVTVDSRTLQQIEQSFETIGNALGEGAAGKRAAHEFRGRLERLRGTVKATPRVVIQLGSSPLVVAGRSFVSEAVEVLGAKNVFRDFSGYPKPSLEEVLRQKPDVLVVMGAATPPDLPLAKFRVVRLTSDSLMRPSPSLVAGLVELKLGLEKGERAEARSR